MNAKHKPDTVDPWAWYWSRVLFPKTTRPQYSRADQVEMDHFNLHNGLEALEQGHRMTGEDLARLKELQFKGQYLEKVVGWMKAAV